MSNEPKPNPMSAAGGSIELAGRTFLLTRTRLVDMEDYLAFLREELRKLPSPVDAVKPSLDGLPERLQRRLIDRAYDDLRRQREIDSPESEQVQRSLSGTAFLLWVHLRWKHPDVSYDDVKRMLADEQVDLGAVQGRLDELQGLSAGEPPADPPMGPVETSPPTGPGSTAVSPSGTAGTPSGSGG